MYRFIYFMGFFVFFLGACDNAAKSKEGTPVVKAAEKKVTEIETSQPIFTQEVAVKKEVQPDESEDVKPISIESDIQFIREKYAIINQGSNYKTVPFEMQCDERTSVKFERRYNEEGALSYLQYKDCGEHGCSTKQHYYWDGQLIFIFHTNDYTPGSSHIIEEHRTYFKNGEMIRCLEKQAHYYEGQAPMAELLKKAKNEEVDCMPEKRTEKLAELENLSIDKAKEYFCSI